MLAWDEGGDEVLLLGSERRRQPVASSPEAAEAGAQEPAALWPTRRRPVPRAAAAAGAAALAAAAAVCLCVALGRRPVPARQAAAAAVPRESLSLVADVFHGGANLRPMQNGTQAAFIPMPGPPPERPPAAPPGPGFGSPDAGRGAAESERQEAAHQQAAHTEPEKAVDYQAAHTEPEKAVDYQVIFEGRIHVRKEKDTFSEVLGDLWKCTIFKAVSDGDWVRLVDRPGYVIKEVPGAKLVAPIPVYYRLKKGSCQDVNGFLIHDARTCELAATAMTLPSRTAVPVDSIRSPEGCYLKEGKELFVAQRSALTVPGPMHNRELICSSYEEPSRECKPITSTTTTTTVAVDSFPSLFCWSVVRSEGYEAPLVRKQLAAKASIFSCNDFHVMSNGGKVWLSGDWCATEIPLPEVHMGDLKKSGVTTNSWLNTEIFMVAWDLVRQDGRFEQHDWTIKADPDAVLFAWRIRELVRPHTPIAPSRTPKHPPFTDALFFLNCNRAPPTPPGKPQLFGAVEIFSKRALLNYYYSTAMSGHDCKKDLDWHGWGEDSYMQHCMKRIGVAAVEEYGWVADNRCIPGSCSDKHPSAFHPFKDPDEWFKCWDAGMTAQPRP